MTMYESYRVTTATFHYRPRIASFDFKFTSGACFLGNRRVVAMATALAAVKHQFIFTLIHRGLRGAPTKTGLPVIATAARDLPSASSRP
jgi:hypothetical protein